MLPFYLFLQAVLSFELAFLQPSIVIFSQTIISFTTGELHYHFQFHIIIIPLIFQSFSLDPTTIVQLFKAILVIVLQLFALIFFLPPNQQALSDRLFDNLKLFSTPSLYLSGILIK
jgi:hypothetical protein